jgi:hypothetical protein
MHQVKGGVDVFKAHDMGDHRVDLDLACMYMSTILGTSVRPLAPPNAVPRQLRP